MRGKLQGKAFRRRAFRASLVGLNLVLLLIVLAVVLLNPADSSSKPQTVAAESDPGTTVVPVDQLASADIAITAAQMADMPEAVAINNQADSDRIELAVASTNNTVVNKPQLVASSFISNKDIHTYVTQPGDTISSVAAKFGVTSDSVQWSNNLTSNTLAAGLNLAIPPTNGIVYTVRAGDTADSLAAKYHSNASQITAYNDAEINGLKPGERIIIPNGTIVSSYSSYSYSSLASGFAWGGGAIYGFNGYDYGNCTWYVATQIAVPANWGNADTWAYGARASGWNVSSSPVVGAIAQTSAGGLGHVGIVIGVNGGMVEVRDMNNYGDGGGYGRVGQEWVPVSSFPNYITR